MVVGFYVSSHFVNTERRIRLALCFHHDVIDLMGSRASSVTLEIVSYSYGILGKHNGILYYDGSHNGWFIELGCSAVMSYSVIMG